MGWMVFLVNKSRVGFDRVVWWIRIIFNTFGVLLEIAYTGIVLLG